MAIIENILIQRAKQGDRAAFGKLVLKYRDRVLALAYDLTGNYTDAQDVAQEAFVAAFRNIKAYQGKSAFYTWIYRISINKAHDQLRKKGRSRPLEDYNKSLFVNTGDESGVWDKHLDNAEISRRINRAMYLLTENQKAVVILKYFHGLSSAEIGDVMDITGNTVRTHLLRALNKLKPVLKDLKEVVAG